MSNTNNNVQIQTSNTLHNAIMESGSKDRPPMLVPANYVQWKSRIKRYIDTKPNHDLIHYCLENPPYKLDWKDIDVPVSKGSPITTTARIRETNKNVSQDIRDQLNAEAEVQIILTGIDNDIYSTVDACPNACEMWKAVETLKQGESINVQDLETNLYWEFRKFTSQDGSPITTTERIRETYKNVSQDIRDQLNVEAEAVQIILIGIDNDIFSTVDACSNACEMWKAIEKLKQGESINELEAHYMYMAQLQEVSPDATDSGPIFDDEPLQKVSTDDHYNVFAMEIVHPEQSKSDHDTYPIEQDAQNVILDSLDMELLEKCKGLETELSKSKMMSKSFESVQKHAINLELELQQCKKKIKNDMLFKVNKTKDFCKEREQYFKIQDLKAPLQDKGIVISELKKLIEKMKGKSVDTKFEKSSVIRQPNAFKNQRPSVLGKPTTFSNSFVRKDFSKSTSVTQTHVSNAFSKSVTTQTLPTIKKSILKNTNVLTPGMYKLHTDHTQTRTSQLPQDSRKTNKRVSFSTG
nr:hypothetical protein [Tanacetum cinerariifolium]